MHCSLDDDKVKKIEHICLIEYVWCKLLQLLYLSIIAIMLINTTYIIYFKVSYGSRVPEMDTELLEA